VHPIVRSGHGWDTPMIKMVPLKQVEESGDTIRGAVTIGIEDD
jgi:hypothetical protein